MCWLFARRPGRVRSFCLSGRAAAVAEPLEPRRLLAASITLQGSTMVIHGDENIASIMSVYHQTVGSLQVIAADIQVQTNPVTQIHNDFLTSQVASVRIDGGNGTDQANVYSDVGKPVMLTDPQASDNDLFRFYGSNGSDTIQIGISGQFMLTCGATAVNIGSFFERVEVLGFDGNDNVHLAGDFFTPTDIYGMGGSDTVDLDHFHNVYKHGLDPGFSTYPVTFDGGGGGTDTLNVNDQAATASTYALPNYTGYPRLQSFDVVNGVVGADLRFINFNAVNVNAGSQGDAFTAAVTSPGMNVTFNGNDGDDSLAVGNFLNSINSPLTFNGGAGSDSMSINNSGFNLNCFYDFGDTFLKFGSISASQTAIIYSGIESKSLVATPFADSIRVEPTDGNLTIDGGTGYDSLSYVGGVTVNAPDRYIITSSSVNYLRRLQPNGGVFGQLNSIAYPNIEVYILYGSDARNNYEVNSTPANTAFTIFAGFGDDYLQMGDASNVVDNIRSQVSFIGMDGANTAIVNDTGDSSGDILHLSETAVGHYPGDTLFGPGGMLIFSDLATLTINLGPGSDAVYAVPNPTTNVIINGGGPSGAAPLDSQGPAAGPLPGVIPGDELILGFATATSPAFTAGGAGAGSYTFANRHPLSYSGIEFKFVDSVAPTGVAGAFLFDAPTPTVSVQFSEDVSSLLVADQLDVYNDTLGVDLPPAQSVSYDKVSNTARFAFASLPDGNYTGTLLSGLSDLAGNSMTDDFVFHFFVLAGDANRDRSVGFADLVVLAQNYGASGQPFSKGDFNYDGTVNFADLVLLAQHYGTSLPPLPAGAPPILAATALVAPAAIAPSPQSARSAKAIFSVKPLAVAAPPKAKPRHSRR